MKKITKKLLSDAISAALALSALPVIGFADAVTETIPVGDNSAWIIDPYSKDKGMQFGLSSANMVRSDSYIYFDLKDISQIEKLELSLTSSENATYTITKYAIADKLPAETDIALYDETTDEYKKWTAFDSEMTQLEPAAQIRIETIAANTPATADITSLINGCGKENGYLVLRVKNGANRSLIFKSSALNVTYKADYTAPNYLDAVNSAMSAEDMETAITAKAAEYFGVDKDALCDMSGVYGELVAMLENEDFTKESFKAAFDAEVQKYIETKEVTIDKIAYFTVGDLDLKFRTEDTGNLPSNLNRNIPFIGAKLDNTEAIKGIELYTYSESNDKSRQFTIRGAYMLDEFKTGNECVYSVPGEGATNEVYSFWRELGDDFVNSDNKYDAGYFNIGHAANDVITNCNDDNPYVRTVDLTDYVKTNLNKYGKDKYFVLHINCGQNMSPIFAGVSGNDEKIPKFIVKYDTTVGTSARAAAMNKLDEAMTADDIKAVVKQYGTALGIDKITKLAGAGEIYNELLLATDSINNIDAFISKANELYNKYTTLKTVKPTEEFTYNSNSQNLSPQNSNFSTGNKYIIQYKSSDLGSGANILDAEYQINTLEDNTFANNTFVRTIPAIDFDGFDFTNVYETKASNENYNEAAANAVAAAGLNGNQWNYMSNVKPVARIKFASGANIFSADITDNLKEQLNINSNKVAYVIGVEEQSGTAKLDNTSGSAAALSVRYDRTYNAQSAMEAFDAAKTADDYKSVLRTYGIEFNITDEQLANLENYSDEAVAEGLAALKTSCKNVFDVEKAFANIDFKTTMIKFETQSFTESDGKLKANVKKLLPYDGAIKVLFVSYKDGVMVKLVSAVNEEDLLTAQKGSVTELTADGSLGEYDTVKVMIINSYAQLEPLAVVYSPAVQQ